MKENFLQQKADYIEGIEKPFIGT